jgi:hypothetical protein
MRRPGDSDARVRHNIDIVIDRFGEAMAWINAQIHLVMLIGNVEGLRQFPRARAKLMFVANATALFHQCDPFGWFDRADQNKTLRRAFHQHIQHPMRAVTKINVGVAGFVLFDERTRAGTGKSVAGFIVLRQIRFGLDNSTGAASPNQPGSDQLARAGDRISAKERPPNDPASHGLNEEGIDSRELEALGVEINRHLHIAGHGFPISKRRNEFSFAHVLEGSIAKSEKWRLLAQDFEIL